jgi:hypothetical protein
MRPLYSSTTKKERFKKEERKRWKKREIRDHPIAYQLPVTVIIERKKKVHRLSSFCFP